MSVTEYERHQLFSWFEEHMGPERATTMMNLVPPVGWGDVATKQDLQHLAMATKHDVDQLGAELRGEMGELRGDMGELRGELRSEMSGLRAEFAAMETRITRTTVKLFASGYSLVVAAIAVLLAID